MGDVHSRRSKALKLYYLDGLDRHEIADRMDLTPDTVSRYLNSDAAEEVKEQLSAERERTYRIAVQMLRDQMAEVEQEKRASDDPQQKYFRRSEHREILNELMELLAVGDLVNEMSGAKDERIELTGGLDDETEELLEDL